MKVTIYGAGAIGGYIAARLAKVTEVELSLVARGAQLEALQSRGITVLSPSGDSHAAVHAVGDPATLGPQDYVFITLKQHQVPVALPGIASLVDERTAVIPPSTGIPYWYFHGLPGPLAERQLPGLDPGGAMWRTLPPCQAVGCAFWLPVDALEPGVVAHGGGMASLPIGEPDGSISPRLERLHRVMTAAGIDAPMHRDIRSWIWMKMISSLVWNPVAALTHSTLGQIAMRPDVVDIVRRMMREAESLAAALGVAQMPWDFDDRIAAALAQADHRMSMLQDLERGRPLEIEAAYGSIVALRELAGTNTDVIDLVYALTRARADAAP